MTSFVILSGARDCEYSIAMAANVREALQTLELQWSVLLDEPHSIVAIARGGRVVAGHAEGHPAFLIGDLFSGGTGFAEQLLASAYSFREVCARLASHGWGAYLAVQVKRCGAVSIFRDPIGMRDAISWSRGRLRMVASDPLPWLSLIPPENLAIDWHRIGELLQSSASVAEAPPLSGIETIAAGTVSQFEEGQRQSVRLWTPRHLCNRGTDQTACAEELKRITIDCVEAWLAAYPNAMIELSGGFDSAAVAAAGRHFSLAANFHAEDLAGDERRYARDVAERHGMRLHEIFLPIRRLGAADIDAMPVGVRPGIGSTTLFHDRTLAELGRSRGVDTLFTGHGGDAIFFQHPTATIASDPSFPRFDLAAYRDLARWCQTSIWKVARHAFSPALGPPREYFDTAMAPLPLAAGFKSASVDWAGDLADLPTAKQIQIRAIGGDRSAFGPSWRSQAMTVIHPLLSQPLVEYAIATDTYLLTKGRRDRALARAAFADLLPVSVSARKGKGSFGHFFGRSLAASTPFLRFYLLDGLLVGHGVLDRTRLEAMLDRDYLMRFDCYAKLLSALIVEQWARVWSDRLHGARQAAAASIAQHRTL